VTEKRPETITKNGTEIKKKKGEKKTKMYRKKEHAQGR